MSGRDSSLTGIRTEIDTIDDGIVDLLIRRAAAQAQVRSQKAAAGTLSQSPIRPAREAEILRRLVDRAAGRIDAQLLVRLWRLILTSSALSQAAMQLHAARSCLEDSVVLEKVVAHFGPMVRVGHASEADAISAVTHIEGDLCVVRTEGDWAEAFVSRRQGDARVIGLLPVLTEGGVPPLLVIGHAASQVSGLDCTILLGDGALSGDAVWSCRSGAVQVTCVPGFLDVADPTLKGFVVAGRVPAQIKV